MKKILTVAAAIILSAGITASAAGTGDELKSTSQKKIYQLSFAKLRVESDIDVMLVENPEKTIEFLGKDEDIALVDWKIKDCVLTVKSKKGSLKGKIKIVVNVTHLKELAIKGESDVRSEGELNSTMLKISLDGTCFISVRNNGNINVVNEDGTELEVRKVVGNVIFG